MVLILDGCSEHGAYIFRVFEGIWLQRKSRQIRIFWKRPISHHACALFSGVPSYISAIVYRKFKKMFRGLDAWRTYYIWRPGGTGLAAPVLLYVQEVVTLQKKIFNILENEVYTIY